MKNMNKYIVINGYKWSIKFVDVEELPNQTDGVTKYNDRQILIRNDLDTTTTKCVLRHELTHAVLCTQGRWLQKKFTQEEVCEFVGFQLPTIYELSEKVMKGVKNEKKNY